MHLLSHSRLWDFHGIPWIPLPLPWIIRTPFPWTSKKQWKFSGKVSGINFLRFLSVSMDSTDNFCGIHGAIGLHFHGIHPMISIDVHATMDAMEDHGRGGILQNSTEAMELDLVENWYKLLRKWPQNWNLHFNCICITNFVNKLLVELNI